MQKSVFIFFFVFCINLNAQLSVSSKQYDFGSISQFNNDTAFFLITNTDSKVAYLLPTHHSDNYLVLVSSKSISPGETIKVGVVYYTEKKGKFKISVPLYFSNIQAPLQLELIGNINSFHPFAIVKCPSMEGVVTLNNPKVPLVISVRDSVTQKEIKQVNMLINEQPMLYKYNFAEKVYYCDVKNYGLVNVYVESDAYQSKETLVNYSVSTNRFVIYLNPIVQENNIDLSVDENTDFPISDTLKQEKSNNNNLSELKYKPNHLIFLIDISGSMKDTNKLNYLKLSINKVINQLRPNDFVSLVTYAGRSKIVFEFVNGSQKALIMQAIDTLSAKGGSYGSDGLITSYELGIKYFIEGANNQVILATDGLFNGGNLSNQDLVKMARRNYQKHELKLSTIGFGKDEKSLNFLKQLAVNGKGNYIRIENTSEDIYNLLEEIKKQSLIE